MSPFQPADGYQTPLLLKHHLSVGDLEPLDSWKVHFTENRIETRTCPGHVPGYWVSTVSSFPLAEGGQPEHLPGSLPPSLPIASISPLPPLSRICQSLLFHPPLPPASSSPPLVSASLLPRISAQLNHGRDSSRALPELPQVPVCLPCADASSPCCSRRWKRHCCAACTASTSDSLYSLFNKEENVFLETPKEGGSCAVGVINASTFKGRWLSSI